MEEPADLNAPELWLQMAGDKLEHARQIFNVGLYDDAISFTPVQRRPGKTGLGDLDRRLCGQFLITGSPGSGFDSYDGIGSGARSAGSPVMDWDAQIGAAAWLNRSGRGERVFQIGINFIYKVKLPHAQPPRKTPDPPP